jgi:hypothetical protein
MLINDKDVYAMIKYTSDQNVAIIRLLKDFEFNLFPSLSISVSDAIKEMKSYIDAELGK